MGSSSGRQDAWASARRNPNTREPEQGTPWGRIAAVVVAVIGLGALVYTLLPEGEVEVELVPVSGVVKINGKPAYAVHVYYWSLDTPKEEFPFRHGIGITDREGKFKIKCAGGAGDGLGEGTYKVTFEQFIAPNGKPITNDDKYEGGEARTSIPKPHSDHENPTASPHEVELSPENSFHEFDLPLKRS